MPIKIPIIEPVIVPRTVNNFHPPDIHCNVNPTPDPKIPPISPFLKTFDDLDVIKLNFKAKIMNCGTLTPNYHNHHSLTIKVYKVEDDTLLTILNPKEVCNLMNKPSKDGNYIIRLLNVVRNHVKSTYLYKDDIKLDVYNNTQLLMSLSSEKSVI